MSFDPNSPYQPPLAGAGVPPARRSRGILFGLAIGCGVLLLLCCGGFAGVFWWERNAFVAGASEDPAVVRQVAAEIAEIPLPADFKPSASLSMVEPISRVKIKGVKYDTKKDGVFLMGEFDAEMSDKDREQFLQQMRGKLNLDNNANENIEVLESKTVDLTMRGKPASFKFAKAQNQDTKAKLWQIMGTFQGKEGPAMIMMIVPLEQFTEPQIKGMLEKAK